MNQVFLERQNQANRENTAFTSHKYLYVFFIILPKIYLKIITFWKDTFFQHMIYKSNGGWMMMCCFCLLSSWDSFSLTLMSGSPHTHTLVISQTKLTGCAALSLSLPPLSPHAIDMKAGCDRHPGVWLSQEQLYSKNDTYSGALAPHDTAMSLNAQMKPACDSAITFTPKSCWTQWWCYLLILSLLSVNTAEGSRSFSLHKAVVLMERVLFLFSSIIQSTTVMVHSVRFLLVAKTKEQKEEA